MKKSLSFLIVIILSYLVICHIPPPLGVMLIKRNKIEPKKCIVNIDVRTLPDLV